MDARSEVSAAATSPGSAANALRADPPAPPCRPPPPPMTLSPTIARRPRRSAAPFTLFPAALTMLRQPVRSGTAPLPEVGRALGELAYSSQGRPRQRLDLLSPAGEAVRCPRAHAAEYHLDPELFGAWGSSARGDLVAMPGTTGDTAEFDTAENPACSGRVKAVADYFGPTDLLQMDARRTKDGMVHEGADSRTSGTALESQPHHVHHRTHAALLPGARHAQSGFARLRPCRQASHI